MVFLRLEERIEDDARTRAGLAPPASLVRFDQVLAHPQEQFPESVALRGGHLGEGLTVQGSPDPLHVTTDGPTSVCEEDARHTMVDAISLAFDEPGFLHSLDHLRHRRWPDSQTPGQLSVCLTFLRPQRPEHRRLTTMQTTEVVFACQSSTLVETVARRVMQTGGVSNADVPG